MFKILAVLFLCAGMKVSWSCDTTAIQECTNLYTETLFKISVKERTKETVCPVLDAFKKCLVDTAKCGKDGVISAMKIVKDKLAHRNIVCAGLEVSWACDTTVIQECFIRYSETLKNKVKDATKETICPIVDTYEKCLVDTAKCEKDDVIPAMKSVKDVLVESNIHCAGANVFLSFGLLVFVYILHAAHSKSYEGV